MKNSAVVASVLAWMMACVAIGEGADKLIDTSISIKGMHCAGCANKVATKLRAVPNVKSASVDAEKGSALVVTTEGKELSPKAIWEAVEGAGYKPTELKGPEGSFKSKPTK
jgi:copper chaperone CopZ